MLGGWLIRHTNAIRGKDLWRSRDFWDTVIPGRLLRVRQIWFVLDSNSGPDAANVGHTKMAIILELDNGSYILATRQDEGEEPESNSPLRFIRLSPGYEEENRWGGVGEMFRSLRSQYPEYLEAKVIQACGRDNPYVPGPAMYLLLSNFGIDILNF